MSAKDKQRCDDCQQEFLPQELCVGDCYCGAAFLCPKCYWEHRNGKCAEEETQPS